MSKKQKLTIECSAPDDTLVGKWDLEGLLLLVVLTWEAWGPAVFTVDFYSGMAGKAFFLLLCPLLGWLLTVLWKDWGSIYGLLGAALLMAAFYQPVWQGLLLLVNAFLDTYSLQGGLAVPFAVETTAPMLLEHLAFFLLLMVFCLLLDLCIRKQFWLGAILLSGLPVALTMGVGVSPVLFIPSTLAFAFCWSLLIHRGALADDQEGRKKRGLSSLCIVLPGLAVLFLAVATLLWNYNGLTAEPEMAQKKEQFSAAIDRIRYESGNCLPLLAGGDLNNQNTAFTDETVLSITLQRPQSVYLKGFTGASYADGVWTQPEEPEMVGDEYQGLLLYLAYHGFYPQVQVGQTTVFQEDTETAWVTVENLAANRKYLFVPYEAMMVSDLATEYANYQEESHISSKGILGARKYTFTMTLTDVDDYALADLSAFLTAPTEQYQEMEQLYRTYVYDAYLDISEQDDALLKKCFDSETFDQLHETDLAMVTKNIRRYFSDNYVFDYEVFAEDSDNILDDFIMGRVGNQTHFATLATLLFREAGIPARYAEGYYLSKSDAAIYTDMPSVTFDLTDRSAHAWVEVYVNGFGWVPVEVTPFYYTEETSDETIEDSIDLLKENPEYFYRRDEVVPPTQEEDVPSLDEPEKPIFVLPCLILLLYLVGCFVYRWTRKKRFHQADTRKALLAVYTYTARLLKSAGYKLGTESVYVDAQACKKQFDLPDGRTLMDFVLLVYAARYDRNAPSEEDAEAARQYAAGLTALICGQKSFFWKVWSWMIGRV